MSRKPTETTRPRAGVALAAVLVCIVVAMTLGAGLVKAVVTQHRQSRLFHQRQQAFWLAESGVQRAVLAINASADYRGETWTVPAAQLDGTAVGIVVTKVAEVTQPKPGWRIEVEAQYPDDPRYRAVCSRELFIAKET